MNQVLVKHGRSAEYPDYRTGGTTRWDLWRWSCRTCGKSGRVWRRDWRYIAYLGVQHVRANHPPQEEEMTEEQTPPCPDCQQGKHLICDGTSWNPQRDEPDGCPCAAKGHQA